MSFLVKLGPLLVFDLKAALPVVICSDYGLVTGL
jgi:hypothetical protein